MVGKEGRVKDGIVVSIVWYSTVQYSTVQYSTVQYSTAQQSTVQAITSRYYVVTTCACGWGRPGVPDSPRQARSPVCSHCALSCYLSLDI